MVWSIVVHLSRVGTCTACAVWSAAADAWRTDIVYMTQLTRLVASDIDGTLVGSSGVPSARTVHVLAAVAAHGVSIVLITGRPLRRVRPLHASGLHYPTLCCNGTLFYNPADGSSTVLHSFDEPLLVEIAARTRDAVPNIKIAFETPYGLFRERTFPSHHDGGGQVTAADHIEALYAPDILKIKVRCESMDSTELSALLAPAMRGVAECASVGGSQVELSPAGVNKGTALAELAAAWKVERAEVAAFGDEFNDLPMLSWAGQSYVTANGHPQVQSAIGNVIGHVDDNAVAETLAAWYGIGNVAVG